MISALVVMMMMRRNGICVVIICLKSVRELVFQESLLSYDMKG